MMPFASFCPWVRVPIWQKLTWSPPSALFQLTQVTGTWWDLLAISVLCRSLPTFRSQERFLFIQSIFGHPGMDYGLQHVLHILDNFFIAEPTRLKCLTSFSTLLRVFMSLQAPVVASKNPRPFPRTRIYGYRVGQHSYGSSLSWR